MSKFQKFVFIVVLCALLLTFAVGCDPENKINEAKEGFETFGKIVDSKQCLEETLAGDQSDACPSN